MAVNAGDDDRVSKGQGFSFPGVVMSVIQPLSAASSSGRVRRRMALAAFSAGLLMSAAGAQARVNWNIDLNLGLPVFPVYSSYPVYSAYPVYGSYGQPVEALPSGAVSVEIGGGHYWRHGGMWYRPWGPRWVIVAPPVVVGAPVVQDAPPAPLYTPAPPSRPDPVIYPRNGQGATQTEADRQACNRWATTQQSAINDASVFQRAVEACMDGRGYTLK
jgi:hypothetical protein